MTKRSIHRYGITILTIVSLIICATLLYAHFHRRPTVVLPDGTRLSLRDAKIGVFNGFQHGTPLEKIFAGLLSKIIPKAIPLPVKQTFGSNTETTSLTLEFQLTGSSNAVEVSELLDRAPSPFYPNWRIRHWGGDGYPFIEGAYPPLFKKYSDGYFAYLTTTTFSRTSRTLHVQLEQRKAETAPWNIVAAFDFPNPNPVTAKNWTVQNYPVKIATGPLTAVLEQVQVQQPREHVAPYYFDIWQHAVMFPFKFYLNDALTTNWIVKELHILDATGNSTLLRSPAVTNGWTLLRGWRSALPTVPWQCKGHFTRRLDAFALEIPVPLFPATAAPITTNFAGVATTIAFASDDIISVTIPDHIMDRRIAFSAWNEQGYPISDDSSIVSEKPHEFRRRLKMDNLSAITLEITLIPLDPDIPFDITIQPAFVPEIRIPPESK